jgi:hypothetical protein
LQLLNAGISLFPAFAFRATLSERVDSVWLSLTHFALFLKVKVFAQPFPTSGNEKEL